MPSTKSDLVELEMVVHQDREGQRPSGELGADQEQLILYGQNPTLHLHASGVHLEPQ